MFPPAPGAPSGQLLVADTRSTPFNQVCRLLVTFTNASVDVASGWIVSGSTIITAAHVFAGPRVVRRIEVCPGFGGNVPRFGQHQTSSFELASSGADCAAVFLGDTVDPRLTPFQPARFDAAADTSAISVLGYTVGDSGRDQFMGSGAFLGSSATLIRYGVATTDGISGGPIFAGASGLVIGVHHDFRQATPIDQALFAQINDWAVRVPVPAVALAFATARSVTTPRVPVPRVAVASSAEACEALGRNIVSSLAPHLQERERLTLVVTDSDDTRLSFRAESIVAGIGRALPGRVACPQLFPAHSLPAPPAHGGAEATLFVRLDAPEEPLAACVTLVGADGTMRWARPWVGAGADSTGNAATSPPVGRLQRIRPHRVGQPSPGEIASDTATATVLDAGRLASAVSVAKKGIAVARESVPAESAPVPTRAQKTTKVTTRRKTGTTKERATKEKAAPLKRRRPSARTKWRVPRQKARK